MLGAPCLLLVHAPIVCELFLWFLQFFFMYHHEVELEALHALLDNVANIPPLALVPELSDNSESNNSAHRLKLMEGVCTIVGSEARFVLINKLGMDKSISYQVLILTVQHREQSLLFVPMIFVARLASISHSLRHITILPLAVVWVLDFCGLARLVAVMAFFAGYILLSEDPANVLSLAIVGLFFGTFASIPLWNLATSRNRDDGCCGLSRNEGVFVVFSHFPAQSFTLISTRTWHGVMARDTISQQEVATKGHTPLEGCMVDLLEHFRFESYTFLETHKEGSEEREEELLYVVPGAVDDGAALCGLADGKAAQRPEHRAVCARRAGDPVTAVQELCAVQELEEALASQDRVTIRVRSASCAVWCRVFVFVFVSQSFSTLRYGLYFDLVAHPMSVLLMIALNLAAVRVVGKVRQVFLKNVA